MSTLPFVIVTAIYAVAHFKILGKAQLDVQWKVGPTEILLSAPSILLFYLREALSPLWIAPAYPLRAVSEAGLTSFWLPAAVAGAALAGLVWLAWPLKAGLSAGEAPDRARAVLDNRRAAPAPTLETVRGIGLALFLVPLLPALNIKAFAPDRIVADRYLYLPSLGLFMILVPSLAELVRRVRARSPAGEAGTVRAEMAVFWIGAAVAALLGLQTIRYNKIWESELTLWTAALASDPNSPSALNEYALLAFQGKHYAEARDALDRALAIVPLTTAHLLRADVATAEKRYADAENDIKKVLTIYPDYAGAYERLALVYQIQGRLAEAESTLRTAIVQAPHRRGAFTDSLGIVLYLQGRRPEALAALEAGRGLATSEMNAGAESILFHLGTLYAEMGRPADARAALEEYLQISKHSIDDQSRTQRDKARATIASLPR
jgi:tetratricopeptide (TPR) repeat protein